MTTTHLLLTAWELDPLVLAACVAGLVLLFLVVRRDRSPRAACLALALVLFFLALASPIGVLSRGYLFSAHMLQHLLLVLAVPPLVLLGLPPRAAPRKPQARAIHPAVPWVMGVGAMWLWHAPTLCNAASQSAGVQDLQTVSLVAMGLAFWWPIVGPMTSRRLRPLAGILYLFTACVACTALGVYVTFSPVEICSVYAHPVDTLGVLPLLRNGWGLGAKADQEIGGLMMWVPTCTVYGGAIMGMLARYYREEEPVMAKEAS